MVEGLMDIMTPDEAIAIVNSKASGRTRYAGQEPYIDEVLVAEIERLRSEVSQLRYETVPADLQDRVQAVRAAVNKSERE